MMRGRLLILLAIVGLLGTGEQVRAQRSGPKHLDTGMSPMGRGATRRARARALEFLKEKGLIDIPDDSADDMDTEPVACDDNGCDPGGGEETDNPNAAQSEVSLAIDASGSHIVIGFNDFRGFNFNPLSISGFAYSDDGGATFVDGGRLPVTANGQISGTLLPQVSGDPDVKYVPGGTGCQFIYSSILAKGLGPAPNFTGTAQTMSIHRSTDCGHTWQGPFEVTPATNPHGVLSGPNARDAADKEFLDVDPDTGRVIMSWSNFSTPALTGITAGVEIRTTFSDNIMSATPPTWSTSVVLNPGSTTFDTGSIPRFAGGGSPNVYVAWATQNLSTGNTNERVARSLNNGVSWNPSVKLNASDVFLVDYILGNDRVHSFPGLAVGPEGNVYVVYAHNGSHDGSDIAFHSSTDGGVTFSPAVMINARPGQDRAQWFPSAAADGNGRLYVIYYDQGVATNGDLTQTAYTFSDNGGVTWSAPAPLMSTGCRGIATDPLDCRAFHAGYGNDTSQPNLGDYIGATSRNGLLYAVWAASPRVVGFADGQPTSFFNAPDFYVNTVNAGLPALTLGVRSFVDSGGNGFIDPGDRLSMTIPLANDVTNPVNGASTLSGVVGTLSTTTPAVSIVSGVASYPSVAPGATEINATPYVVQIDQSFAPGTPIELALTISTSVGSEVVRFTQQTGTPIPTTIFSENFNGVPAGSLPAGWATIHAGGANTVPWTTNNAFCSTSSNGLFHANANDGPGTGGSNPTRFERVASPNISIPSNGEYVTLDFDICYDTEDDPGFNVLAYDGALLRITDFTTGRFARANLVEAFADSITTGSIAHYPKHNPRSSNAAYFQDMSMWSGFSNGFQHVHMRLPGMAGSVIQLRPDYTQDSLGTCADVRPGHSCGVMIDNIVLRSVVSATTVTTATAIVSSQNPSDLGATVTFTATVTAGSPATTGTVTFRDGATVLAAGVAVNGSGQASFTTSALASGSHTISATYDGTAHFATSSASLVQLVDVQPTIAINDVSVTEGNAGTTTAVFTVTLSAATHTVTASVAFATANGSATAGSDYQATNGTLSFSPGTTTRTFSVLVNGDFVIEPNEAFVVNLSAPSNATIADSQGVGTIVNDDSVASTLAALVSQVSACSGGLTSGQCQSLLTRLAAAQADLSAGRTAGAIHALEQFVDDVQRFSRSIPGDGNPPRLDPATAAVWIVEAQSIIAMLAL